MNTWGKAGRSLAALAAVLLAVEAQAQSGPEPVTLIRGARVFDGRKTLGVRDVLIRGATIAQMGQGLTPPAGAAVVDARGKTLLPGLIDSHTHNFGSGLTDALAFGVTTSLDMFTDVHMAISIRDRQAKGELPEQSDLFSAGTLVTAPRGHGTEYGMQIPTISSPDSAQSFVDARLREGSAWIKIVYDNGAAYGMNIPTLDLATLRAVIEAAHKRGKLAVVHIGDQRSAREAIEAGADGLVHLFADETPDPAFVRLVAERRAFIIPTLTVEESVTGTASGAGLLQDAWLKAGISPDGATNLQRAFPRRPESKSRYSFAADAVRQLRTAGVTLLAGTDAPNPGTWYGVSLHRELELLVAAGLTPAEALSSATAIPAEKFRLADRGRVAKGLRADLVLVNGDPLTDIHATRDIAAIWKRGVALDRAKYMANVAAAVASASHPAASAPRTGMVSDFEEGTPAPRAAFGAGWMITTDAMRGGKSLATMNAKEGGANGSAKSLAVEGTVADGGPTSWAGVMFMPGDTPMQPSNLSSNGEFRFWARGDGRTYNLMLFAQSKGMQPIIRTFTAGAEWKEFAFKFSEFDGSDGHDLMGIAFTAGIPAGAFALRLDQLRFR